MRPICNVKIELIKKALFHCNHAGETWFRSLLDLLSSRIHEDSILDRWKENFENNQSFILKDNKIK